MDLRWILDTLPVGLWVARVPDGEVAYANPEFQRILGVEAAPGVQIEGAPAAYGIFTREGRPYPVEKLPFSLVAKSGRPATVDDIVIRRPDGRHVHIRAFGYPAFDAAGRLTHVGVAFLDNSAAVRAEAERDRNEARLALAVNHAPIVIWAADRTGIVTLSEGAGLSSMGVKSGQLVGANLFDLYKEHPSIPGYLRRGLAGESFWYTVQVGEAVYDTWLVPLRDADGSIAGLAGLSNDVSQVRKLQASAIQHDRAIALGTLAASVAHEINNPLTYMLGHLDLLGGELAALEARLPALEEPQRRELFSIAARMREALETTRAGTERIAGITRELGSFSHPASDDNAAVDVRAVVNSVLKLVRKEVEARALLHLALRETAPLRGNASRLVQVILNLVVNALQALPEGRPGENQIWVSTRNEGEDVVIEVADSGPGVPAAERERIFEPFVTTKDVGQGSGLGLFVCRNIVTGFGGRVQVDDRPGGGARFRVVLPAAKAPARPSPAPSKPPIGREAPASARVLIIDDDPAVGALLRDQLAAAGYRASFEADASRALEALAAGAEFDLVYCDLMMQGTTGMDLAEALAARAPAQLAKVLFMTGGAYTPRARDFQQRHAGRVVGKPFDILAETARRLGPA